MFNKIKFAQILKNISETYENQRDFSAKSTINRTYLSQYMNMKLEQPPKPKILDKIANASHGVVTYGELMDICGYLNTESFGKHLMNKYNLTEKEFNFVAPDLNEIDFLSSFETTNLTDLLLRFLESKDKNNFDIEQYLPNTLSDEQKNNIKKAFSICYREIIEAYQRQAIITQHKQLYNIPVYGQISAGQPHWAEENIEGYLPIDPNLMGIVNPQECFFLRVNR